MIEKIEKSHKLADVCYDIRGPVLREARRLEEEGFRILKLNIGNPASFGFDAPDELFHDMILNLRNAQGYSDSKGQFSARKAVMQHYQKKGLLDVQIEDIYIGNGVSELITMSMNALLNNGDEVLVPAPDYPLWTASVTLSGGKPVHYICDEQSDWQPDVADIESKITDRTRALVVINPNNPTGAVYSRDVLQKLYNIAAKHKLILFADEIYDKILYEDAEHVCLATLGDEVFCVTMNGLSKAYRAAGFRSGWMLLTGPKLRAADYIDGLDILANMRLCSNVPAQYAIQASLGGYQSINDLVLPGGRLREQRDLAYRMLTDIPGITCVKPKGALYLFPRLDPQKLPIQNDQQFILQLLIEKRLLLVQGSGFNWPGTDHLRVVFLPDKDTLIDAMTRLREFIEKYPGDL